MLGITYVIRFTSSRIIVDNSSWIIADRSKSKLGTTVPITCMIMSVPAIRQTLNSLYILWYENQKEYPKVSLPVVQQPWKSLYWTTQLIVLFSLVRHEDATIVGPLFHNMLWLFKCIGPLFHAKLVIFYACEMVHVLLLDGIYLCEDALKKYAIHVVIFIVKVFFHNMLWLLYVVFGASLKPFKNLSRIHLTYVCENGNGFLTMEFFFFFRKFVCIITNAEILYKTYLEWFLLKIVDVNCTGIYKYTKNIKGISIQLFSRTV